MAGFSPAFRKSVEDRIKSGTIKVSGINKEATSRTTLPSVRNESMEKLKALGRMKSREMNKTELAYSQHLEVLKACGDIAWWKFESITLRLADNMRYTVDFFVMRSNGALEAHEIKGGHAFEDSIVKLKVAAEIFPWDFFLISQSHFK